MANVNSMFPSKYISAADLQGREAVVTIARMEMEHLNQGEDPKPVLYFQGKHKGLVLNKTNAMNVSTIYGPETDAWMGKSITLYTTWVDFQGRSVEAIRIRPQVPQNGSHPADPAMQGPPLEPFDEGDIPL